MDKSDKSHLMPGGRGETRGFHADTDSESDPRAEFFSTHLPSRPVSPMGAERDPNAGHRRPSKIVLCFDGTGNKFHGDDSDSNILKIYRMLDRTATNQYHYYQPGIGTYVVSNSLTHTGAVARMKSWYLKAKDSAIGSSFDQHVVGGYRFLMRFYNPGDEIYIFGFSRGAYIARFLAEMLDYVGLLSHGNEEMVVFAWKAFSRWQARQGDKTEEGQKKKKEMYSFMKGFRETFSRPVRRIRFLGLFDTVNSVPRFETAWMERSKFPYTARTSAKVIRHAVAIDERRAKFRQDLIYQSNNSKHKQRNSAQQKLHDIHEKYRRKSTVAPGQLAPGRPSIANDRGRRETLNVPADMEPYRRRSHSTKSRQTRMTERSGALSTHDDGKSEVSIEPHPHVEDVDDDSIAESEDEHEQDIDEVWFAGGHADIGGGWEMLSDSKSASHVPLVWMVHEAIKAGLQFDVEKMQEMGCLEAVHGTDQDNVQHQENCEAEGTDDIAPDQQQAEDQERPPLPGIFLRTSSMSSPLPLKSPTFKEPFNSSRANGSNEKNREVEQLSWRELMHKAHVALIHDSLEFDCGLSKASVLAWKIMEYMPFRRMDLQEDGSWKPIRWPLPCGEVRDIPDDARIHASVIRRMQTHPSYRPGNLLMRGGGRGKRRAPEEYGTGEWVCVKNEDCPVGEIVMKKSAWERMQKDGENEKNGRVQH
ncbi:hypothetical protein QBC38DRAFT_489493 [Podospora fimiseda]|uniref:T6SS Phospholipase effector Tle1-like catalytic domain-containing protein n=1 Tax=Podospora fimiseda TaxID=252190 RepID=A0AAN6YNM5_9PEZI|nr:hypothetical protein QBC38DRAFT_489493 [Podospora fimiseda]